jgi:hypothetical protein
MSILTVRDIQGLSAFQNKVRIPSGHQLSFDGNLKVPVWTTGTRPVSPEIGLVGYNTTDEIVEIYDGTDWIAVGGGNKLGTGTQVDPFTATGYPISSSGNYFFKTSSMTTATQYYVDTVTPQGPWIRIFFAVTDDYATTSFSWPDAQTANLIEDSTRFMYCFLNPSTNVTTQAWSWWFFDGKTNSNYNAFKTIPPMGHGGVGAPLITKTVSTQLSSSTNYNGYWLRTGISSFGSNCDSSRGGTWGQICMKNRTESTDPGPINEAGLLDFPHYATYSVSGTDDCSQSNQGYNVTKCSSTRRFAIYVKL